MLDLKPEEAVPGALGYDDLVALWPRLFAFFLTFLVGGSFWVDHHEDMETIVERNRSLLWLNLMFLLAVSLLPFTTDLLGRDSSGSASWTLYALNMICCGLTLTAMWAYAAFAGLSKQSADTAERWYQLGSHLIVPVVFAISIVVGFISPRFAPVVAVLLPFVFQLYRRVPAHQRRQALRPEVPAAARLWQFVGYTPLILFAAWSVGLKVNGQI